MTKEELYMQALEELKSNDELFILMVEELDNYSNFADTFRAHPMDELDMYYAGYSATQLFNELTSDFNINDNYFYNSIYGLESTDDRAALYRDNTDEKEVLDALLEIPNKIYYYRFTDFKYLLEDINDAEE